MTSNVGTLAFKAPEFFQRTSPGTIEYHRNVDIYAAGLTFLAILQAKKGQKMLIPHIETSMDDSELHVPSIGQLIAERIKYKVPELNIVNLKNIEFFQSKGQKNNLKWLISQMACVDPEKRLSAKTVLDFLNRASFLADHEIQKKKLVHSKTLTTSGPMDITEKDQLLVRVKVWIKYWIRVLDRQTGDLINDIPSMCSHYHAHLNKHPLLSDSVLEYCFVCGEIRAYHINTKESFVVYKDSNIIRMCDGPSGSLLVLDTDGRLSKLNLDEYPSRPIFMRKLPSKFLNKRFLRCYYVAYYGILTYTVERGQHYEIIAIKVEGGDILWRLFGPVDGCIIKPKSITCDQEGNAYVNELATNRILKINSLTGDVLSILLVDEGIDSLCWSNAEPNLTLREGHNICSYFVPSEFTIRH